MHSVTLACIAIFAVPCAVCAAEPKAATGPESVAHDVSCADGFELDTNIGRLVNNTWNRQAVVDAPYRQCLRVQDIAGARQYGWSWNWPTNSTTLLAYPQAVFGWKPWNGGASTRSDLPIRVGAVRAFTLKYSVETTWNAKANLAASLWLTRTGRTGVEPTPADITADLNIWFGADVVPTANKVGTLSLDGVTFEVWFAPAMGNASGATGNQWNHIVYRSAAVHTDVSLDIGRILEDAVARKFIDAGHYVSSVELGNEVMSGSGQTWLKELTLRIE